MKKTTYILLGLVALIFVIELAIGIFLYSTRMSGEEVRKLHPDWFGESVEVISDDYYIQDTELADEEADDFDPGQRGTTVVDAADGGYNVLITRDNVEKSHGEVFYTDTLIITSPSKNIRVVR